MTSVNSDINFVALEDDSADIICIGSGGSNSDRPAVIVLSNTPMSLASRLLATLITLHVVYIAVSDVTLFSLHPTCMIIGYLLVMMEAVITFSPEGGLLQKFGNLKKTTAHWILQTVSATLITLGFTAIVVVKFQKDKPHFYTWHAFLGLISVICVGGASCGGIAALYSQKLKSILKPNQMKIVHASFGVLTLSLGLITLVLGFFTHWFTRNSSEVVGFIYSALIIVLGLKLLMSPLKNLSSRIKRN